MSERSDNLYRAKLADQAKRYADMAEAMKKTVKMGEELTVEERHLLSAAFKNQIGKLRSSWRVVNSIQRKEEAAGNVENLAAIRTYREQLENELGDVCMSVLDLVQTHLVLEDTDNENKVFYSKMQADYCRYLAEFTTGPELKEASKKAQASYNRAWQLAMDLPPTHPLRLGLALNFSVFHYEIMHSIEQAIALARSAFDSALGDLDKLSEENYKDSTLIMQLLRDNLTLWMAAKQTVRNIDDDGAPENQN
ncbi:14-3-3 protein epsilon-like isoform X3 [Drosophila pseudoobscura]|uniref:14-3-3 protein epsilon-like isoform X3 n=2 Tax=Drosophila pseudoobscura pseudoobscura TaxID=46245 RepID=B5DKW8_DROPS|nr:14-3-3 protein epsilon isoform X3 [Drosophila pseudoobscura]